MTKQPFNVLRKNESGCVCKWSEDEETIVSICNAHKDILGKMTVDAHPPTTKPDAGGMSYVDKAIREADGIDQVVLEEIEAPPDKLNIRMIEQYDNCYKVNGRIFFSKPTEKEVDYACSHHLTTKLHGDLQYDIDFIWRWIERMKWDDKLSIPECLSVLIHYPSAPWKKDRKSWDTKHKEYDERIDADLSRKPDDGCYISREDAEKVQSVLRMACDDYSCNVLLKIAQDPELAEKHSYRALTVSASIAIIDSALGEK